MTPELTTRILQQYGLQPVNLKAVQKGYRNEACAATFVDGRTLNLILYKREPDILDKIRNAAYVSDFLAAHGLPVRATADRRIVQVKSRDAVRYAGLHTYLPGTTIPWEAYTMDHIKALGAMMSDMHASLGALKQGNLPHVVDESRILLKRMEDYFAEDGVHDAMASKLGLSIPDTTRLRPALTSAIGMPSRALHMDFVRGNILFKNDEPTITGVIDFEKAAWGPAVFDIARTLAFLIVDCKYKTEDKVRKYFLHSGYNKRGASQFAPSQLLEDLLDFFLLYDFYKFLRHNPYESLKDNGHFVRTRDFLLKRNILIKTKMLE